MAKSNSVGLQAVLLSGSTAVSQILMALMYLVTARSLDPADFGLVVTAIAVANVLAGVSDFGANSLWVREIARDAISRDRFSSLFGSKLLLCAAGGAFIAMVFVLFVDVPYLWAAVPVGLGVVFNQASLVGLRSQARGDLVSIFILAERLVAVLLFGLLALVDKDMGAHLWFSLAVGSFTAGGLALLFTPRKVRPRARLSLVNPWAGSRYFGLSSMSTSLQSLDVPILSAVAGGGAAGLYGAVSRWTQPMGLLASAYSSASAPYIAKSKSIREAWSYMRRGVWLPTVAILACVVVVIGAPVFVDLLIGSAYLGAAPVLRILAAGTIFGVLNQPLAVLLQNSGHDRYVSRVSITGVPVQLLSVVSLAFAFGAAGAATAFAILQLWITLWLSVKLIVSLRSHP